MNRHIFIFNPETDYALALGTAHYNPPRSIIKLRKAMQLIPACMASTGDVIIVSEDFSPKLYPDKSHLDMAVEKKILTIPLSRAAEMFKQRDEIDWRVVPWGWNHTLRCQLLDAGFNENLLKTEKEIDTLRSLSHRHTTIPFQESLKSSLPEMKIKTAKEFFTVDEAVRFASLHEKVFFKAPWSSSGRGVIQYPSPILSEHKLKEWLNGFIHRQGSVMGEPALNRVIDFATEWYITDGKAHFLGLSIFNTTKAGRYLGNMKVSQEEIDKTLSNLSPYWNEKIISAQLKAIEDLISPYYSGPVGLDMLMDSEGTIDPCVEINLRHTMGMISLNDYSEKINTLLS